MVKQRRLGATIVLLLSTTLWVSASCTDILGINTEHGHNPCDADAEPERPGCGVGACHRFPDACENGLPVECTPGEPEDEETPDGIDNDCDEQVDQGLACGEDAGGEGVQQACYTASPGTRNIGACHDGIQTCDGGFWTPCADDMTPKPEACDKLDNDCDGSVDEGCPCTDGQEQTCYGGPEATRNVGPCKDGKQKCEDGAWGECVGDTVPKLELCNKLDDDCDGTVDLDNDACICIHGDEEECYEGEPKTDGVGLCEAGTRKCISGQWGECEGQVLPKTESCDGVDNDCNGKVDDSDFGGNELCDAVDNNCNGAVDEGNPGGGLPCDTGYLGPCAPGKTECAMGTIICKQLVSAFPETCDGLDNDCDGAVDNGNPGSGSKCTVPGTVGACAVGAETCQGGQLVCKQTVVPTPELCNGVDDDCDGQTDEGNPESGTACNVPDKSGVCKAGINTCADGHLVCQQLVLPAPAETCDKLDNDCDGQVDEDNPGGGGPCTVPGGIGECAKGQFACQNGVLNCVALKGSEPEICDGEDDDCNGVIDNGNPGGGGSCTVPGGIGECSAGKWLCQSGSLICNPNTGPAPETCNGKDDDCNGVIDNGNPGGGAGCATGNPGVCGPGTMACVGGTLECQQKVQSSAEKCDGLDNDCNGQADEGNPGGGAGCSTGNPGTCAAGTLTCQNGNLSCLQNTQPSAEVCDGLDNNCSGQADEGDPGGGAACITNQPGICGAGAQTCQNGALICKPNLPPSAEVCDGLDNNCDGLVDNGNPGGGAPCYTGLPGVCAQGTTGCQNGALACVPNQYPAAEVCDGLDNDCNGVADNGNPGGGVVCAVPGKLGPCAAGVTACSGGALVCSQTTQPSAELCDGVDNDCNGTIDNGNPGGGAACQTGLPGVCGPGTTACQGGSVLCLSIVSSTPEICDGLDNNCDGAADNGNPGGNVSCTVSGKQGECRKGLTLCSAGALLCNQVTFPSLEGCDGLDNDCDGTVDEDNPDGGASCDTGAHGVCEAGTHECAGGTLECVPNDQPSAEECDGLDNNCDGTVDEGNPGGGAACTVSGQQGECAKGATECQNGAATCVQVTFPLNETCTDEDSEDLDCDGRNGKIFFRSDFSDAASLVGTTGEWAIGPAQDGCGDPADDATPPPSGDQKVAGVAIGACVASGGTGELTTPPIIIPAGSPVFLHYRRWLNTNPDLLNQIEVSDDGGMTWSVVFTTIGVSVADVSWTEVTLDVSPHVDPAATSIVVRWSYVNGAGNMTQGGWSIDDVLVTDDTCD